jgi:catechol 2,3-dioxygenase-like lactoylglutathione lyase family enzyme
MKLDGMHHIGINVRDLDRALEFYTGMLGFEVTERYQESIRHVMLVLGTGSTGLHLFETKDLDQRDALTTLSHNGYSHLAFGTTRELFPKWIERLKINDIDFKGPLVMGKGESIHFHDPDGHALEIRCPARASREE